MITSNVIHRVFHIKYGNGTGSCFAIDHGNKQYIVTAKHVINGLKEEDEIEFFNENTWKKTKVKLIGHSDVSDVSVFTLNQIIGIHPLPATKSGLVYGQSAFFLGFPYMTNIENGMNRSFPMPMVKSCTVSLWFEENGAKKIFLDGHNNPGFSGGPVVFVPPSKKWDDFQIAGIISGYRNMPNQVYDKVGNMVNAFVNYNTGIILAFDIKHAIDIIETNPLGMEIS